MVRESYLNEPFDGSGDVLGELRACDWARRASEVLCWDLEKDRIGS